MSFNVSAGVYTREINQSHIVAASGNSVGAIVIESNKGPEDERILVTNNKQFIDTFGEPSNVSMRCALAFLEKASQLYVVRKTNDAATSTVNVVDAVAGTTFVINALGGGVYGDDIDFAIALTGDAEIFLLTILYLGVEVESFNISKIVGKVDGFGRSAYLHDAVNGNSNYISVVDTTANALVPAVISATTLAGGTDDTAAPAANTVIAGYELFDIRDQIEVSLLINAGWEDISIKNQLVTTAELRKDCIAIIDTSVGDSVAEMITESGTVSPNSNYAAMYGPWLNVYDQYSDSFNVTAPSGHVAGVYAQTALNGEVWEAPAGSRRGSLNVAGVELTFTEGERDALYAGKVNPIQQFFGEGIQVYGQRTMTDTDSALNRVNVRMLMIEISKTLQSALKPFVFEINDTFLRDNITSIITNYLEDIRVRRGVYDYSAVCDTTNNTPQVIDQNKLIVDVYVKPSRVAEFIRVNAIVSATGVSFT